MTVPQTTNGAVANGNGTSTTPTGIKVIIVGAGKEFIVALSCSSIVDNIFFAQALAV